MERYLPWMQAKESRAGSGKKALILSWTHASNTVFSLASSLAGGLGENGVESTILNLSDRRHLMKLKSFHRQSFEQIFILGSPPLRAKYSTVPIVDRFDSEFYFWVLDPIIYDLDRTEEVWEFFEKVKNSDRIHLLFPDRSYMKLVEDWIGNKCIYFPFAGNFAGSYDMRDTALLDAARRDEVLVLANIGQELSEFAPQSLEGIIGVLDPFGLNERQKSGLAGYVREHEQTSNVALAVGNYMQLGAQELFTAPVVRFIAALDASEKRRRRIAVIDSIKSLRLEIVGSGWQKLLGDRPNITYRTGPVAHENLTDMFLNYKVLLDFSPNWDHGFNDRVVPCIGAGCRVATSRNEAVSELGDASTLVTTYSMHHPKPEAELEQALKAPPIDSRLIAQVGEKHNWGARIRQLGQ
jgi:hypothetical protein